MANTQESPMMMEMFMKMFVECHEKCIVQKDRDEKFLKGQKWNELVPDGWQ